MRSGYCLEGIAVFLVGDWGYLVFLAAADLVMILRVHAMWSRSGKVLGILLFIYVPTIATSVVWEVIYSNPEKTLSVTIVQVLDYSYCSYSSSSPPILYRAIPRFVLGVALLTLAVIPTFKQSVEMYKLTKRWKTSPSMKLLVREGAVYFVVNLLFNIVTVISVPNPNWMLFMDALGYSLSCAIMARFIISIRELYHRDVWDRWQGIDTGFGVFSQTIDFVDVDPERGEAVDDIMDDSRVIRLEAVGDSVHQV